MRLLRIPFESSDAQGHQNGAETIAGRLYLRFFDLDLDAAGQARCHRIVPQSALSSEAWTRAIRFLPIDVAELVSYGPYTPEELFPGRKHAEDIRNADREEAP